MKGGFLTFLSMKVISIIAMCALILAALTFTIGQKDTVSFSKTATVAVGTGFGEVFGLIPSFAKAMHDGHNAVAPSAHKKGSKN